MFKVDMEWEIGKNKCYICNIYRCNAGMKITKKHWLTKSVPADTFQEMMSWLNLFAPENMERYWNENIRSCQGMGNRWEQVLYL